MERVRMGIHPSGDGTQALYRFPNGLVVSVIRSSFSYGGRSGLYEAAVICGKTVCEPMGWLTVLGVLRLLRAVKEY